MLKFKKSKTSFSGLKKVLLNACKFKRLFPKIDGLVFQKFLKLPRENRI